MPKEVDYFINHSAAVRFPFTIYHTPIEKQIDKELADWPTTQFQALNLGCGLFATYPRVKNQALWSACDLDQRAVNWVQKHYPEVKAFVCDEIPDLRSGEYDCIVAKEVIEHTLQPTEWLRALYRGLKPGGKILLSTPNYGWSLLPIVEYTILEILARLKGFSRFGIHPTKFNNKRLDQVLHEACPDAKIEIKQLSVGMVLFAKVQKPLESKIIEQTNC